MTITLLLMLVAVILWFIAAFGVAQNSPRFNLIAAGLALFGLAYILGPLGIAN